MQTRLTGNIIFQLENKIGSELAALKTKVETMEKVGWLIFINLIIL